MGATNGIPPCTDRAARVRPAMGRRRSAKNTAEEGSALVETALVLPIICLLMTGIFSFSIALYQKLELAQAVASGARFISTDRGDTDPCASTVAKIRSAAPTLTAASINATFVLNGNSYNANTCTAGAANMTTSGTAQVSATYPCTLSAYGMSFGACSISESVTVEVQ